MIIRRLNQKMFAYILAGLGSVLTVVPEVDKHSFLSSEY